MSTNPNIEPIVRHRQSVASQDCPYGEVQRIVTGGEGGVANVHVVRVTRGLPHVHTGYSEIYYVLAGTGTLTLSGRPEAVRPGSVAVIPAGVPHAVEADGDEPLEFIIFGTPPMRLDDPRARPEKAV